MNKKRLIAVSPMLLLSSLILTACGGEKQDEGTTATYSTTFNGVAVDGALARATVYLDGNDNSTRDPWEDSAFTDNDGYYSFNPKTQTNYCLPSTPSSEKIYCLQSSRSYTNVIVRIDGGYDLLTGEPFVGQMSRRVDVPEDTGEVDSVISPLTSLLTNVTSPGGRENILASLRISESDLDVNYVDVDNNGGIEARLLNASLKVHKTVVVLADRLNDTYSELNDETGVMNDPSSEIYRHLATELESSDSASLDVVLSNTDTLARVLDRSETVLRNLYEEKELVLPADMGSESSLDQFERVVDVVTLIPDVVNQVINPVELSNEDAVGGSRALESLIIKSTDEEPNTTGVDESIEFAARFLTTESAELEALTSSLASELADVTSLASSDFTFESEEEASSAASLPEDAMAFEAIAGMQIRVSDLDLGTKNARKDIEIEFYFNGTSEGIDGQFTACAKYIEDAEADGTLGDGNTRGELVNGYWTLLGATESNRESYNLLLTIEFLGTTYQAIMKTIGTTTIEGVQYNQVRFDNSGEYRVWHSIDGMVETQSLPTSNLDCEELLTSRVGL